MSVITDKWKKSGLLNNLPDSYHEIVSNILDNQFHYQGMTNCQLTPEMKKLSIPLCYHIVTNILNLNFIKLNYNIHLDNIIGINTIPINGDQPDDLREVGVNYHDFLMDQFFDGLSRVQYSHYDFKTIDDFFDYLPMFSAKVEKTAYTDKQASPNSVIVPAFMESYLSKNSEYVEGIEGGGLFKKIGSYRKWTFYSHLFINDIIVGNKSGFTVDMCLPLLDFNQNIISYFKMKVSKNCFGRIIFNSDYFSDEIVLEENDGISANL